MHPQYAAEVYEAASIDDKDEAQHSYQQANILVRCTEQSRSEVFTPTSH